MNGEEIQSLISQLKASGLNEEQIMDVFYETFKKGEMNREDLESLANAMGYELTDEFKKEETPDPIVSGSEESGEAGISKEEAEAAKALEPGESKEEFKEKIEEAKTSPAPEAKPEGEASTAGEGEESKKEESEEEEWEKAQKLFKI